MQPSVAMAPRTKNELSSVLSTIASDLTEITARFAVSVEYFSLP